MRRCLAVILLLAASIAHADAVDSLRDFVREAKSGSAAFTQTVTSPDGTRKKVSSGSFEFARPNRFRFAYRKPYEQLIVGDGERVWLYDVDLRQVTVRAMDRALGATPAALLAGGALERDFDLRALPAAQGLEWVEAQPKVRGDATGFPNLRVGFRGKTLAALEVVDGFGQRSQLAFSDVVLNGPLAPDAFRFTPPQGADVIKP